MGEYTKEQPAMDLPDSMAGELHLTHPTPEERLATWKLNGVNWGAALKSHEYLEREAHLMTVPLAKDGGVTHWILVDSSLPPNSRPILGTCESLRKRVFVSRGGVVTEAIAHGIGSVFCDPTYRGKGYASRMLKEIGHKLKEWQAEESPGEPTSPFSFLYSDIGRKYYANQGWHVFPSTHISLLPASLPTASPRETQLLVSSDIAALCALDETRIRKQLSEIKDGKTHVALVPDDDTMQWHHLREEFMTSKIFGKSPSIKGALIGEPGSRVWVIWTRSFYGPLTPESGNALYILRLVIEDESASPENAEKLKTILQIAQAEALEWQLGQVVFWNPTQVVKELVKGTGLEYREEDRQDESITSLMWYGEGSGKTDQITWFANEKFGWC